MTARLRLVAWQVQPLIMVDDGDRLTSLPVAAVTIPAAEWEAFKGGGDEAALDQLRAQLNGHVSAGEAAG
jgi:hypothetical protein